MCKPSKPKPAQLPPPPPPEVLHNPFTDGDARGVVGAYFARRIGRSSFRINRGGPSVLLTSTGLTYDPTTQEPQASSATSRPIGPQTDLPNAGYGRGGDRLPRYDLGTGRIIW